MDSWTRPWWKTDEAIREEEALEREQAQRRWADRHAEEVARMEKATGRPVREDAERVRVLGMNAKEADEELARRVADTRAGDLNRFSDPFIVQALVRKLPAALLPGWGGALDALVRAGVPLDQVAREVAARKYAEQVEGQQVRGGTR